MIFPLTLPAATAFYLVLYLGTLVLHVVFMSYVLAGSAYLAARTIGRRAGNDDPFAALLRSWLPFMLGMAITAGVAPLLFVQVLYRAQFYTANLLLFHRWMAVLPVLIVGFYLLYLIKDRGSEERSPLISVAITAITAACFAFVAWSWTENSLLSLQGQEVWSEQYLSDALLFHSAEVFPRLGMWFCGSFAVLSIWLSWQIWWTHRGVAVKNMRGTREAAVIGTAGLIAGAACGGIYWLTMPAIHREALTQAAVVPFGVMAGIAIVGQIIVWSGQYRSRELCPKRMTLLSTLALLMLLGVAVLRESIRIASLNMTVLAQQHEQAAKVGGFGVFLVFLAINAVGIGWCLRAVVSSHNLATPEERTDEIN